MRAQTVMLLGFLLATNTYAQTVSDLLKREATLNGTCRGGSGDSPATQKACEERDRIGKQLEAQGWCYGPQSVPQYQKKWGPCRSEYDKSNWVQLTGPDGIWSAVDLNSIEKAPLGAGRQGRAVNFHLGQGGVIVRARAIFDCKGNYQMISPKYEPERPLNTPLSQQISDVACN